MARLAELYLTDGTVKCDLLSGNKSGVGISVSEVTFNRNERETDSIFADLYKTVTETYRIRINDRKQDQVFAYQRILDGLLIQAENYFVSEAETRVVWLVSKSSDETKRRYAIVFSGGLQTYGNFYDQPFTSPNSSVTNDLDLVLVRGAWLANPPLTPSCKPITNTVNWQNYVVPTWTQRSASATSGNALYTITSNGNMFAGVDSSIMISTNNGTTWANSKALSAGNIAFQFIVAFGKLYAAVARAAGANADTGIWRATLAGGSWTQEVSLQNQYNLAILPDGRLISGGDGIIRVTTGNGSWSTYSNIYSGAVKALAVTKLGTVLAGDTYDLFRKPDGGSFSLVNSVHGLGPFLSIVSSEDRLWLLATSPIAGFPQPTEIDVSIDDGNSFQLLYTTVITNIYYSTLRKSFYFSVITGVYSTADNGLTWVFDDLSGAIGSGGFTENNLGNLFNINSNKIFEKSLGTVASGPLSPTDCYTPVYVGNRSTEAMLSYIMYYDDNIAAFFNVGIPLNSAGSIIFPASTAVNDILYLGSLPIASGIHSAPNSFVFNITTSNKTITLTYEYWNGAAWTAFAELVDTTNMFKHSGVISWVVPTNWATSTVNAISGLWFRAKVTAVGSITAPPKANNIYSPARNYIEIANVKGDIPALAKFKITNVNDGGDGANWTRTSSMLVALRTVDRGPTFNPYLIASTPYNPASVGTIASMNDRAALPIGLYYKITPNVSWENYVGFYVGYVSTSNMLTTNILPRDYYGTYRVFLRYSYYGTDQAITMRLVLKNVGEQIFSYGEPKTLRTVVSTKGNARLLDMGQFAVGTQANLSPSEVGSNFYFDLQAKGIAPYNQFANIYELILVPVDEWVGYFEDVNRAVSINNYGGLVIDASLDLDSATYFKRKLRALIKNSGSDVVISSWSTMTTGALMLQPGKTQRFYFFSELWNGEYLANPFTPVHRIQVVNHERYLGGRGND